jgi:WD40 repeat protein
VLAASAADGVVRLWDVETGREKTVLKSHRKGVTGLALSRDGATAVSADLDGTVKVWDTAGPQGVVRVKGFDKEVRRLEFTAGGTLLAADRGGAVVRLEASTGRRQGAAAAKVLQALSVAFSPDGRLVALGTIQGEVQVCDVETGKERFTLKPPAGLVYGLAFSPDGKTLAGASGTMGKTGHLTLWSVETGKERYHREANAYQTRCVAFAPDGRTLATGGADGTLKVWEAATGEERWSVDSLGHRVMAVAFSPDGRRLACAAGDATVYDAGSGRQVLKVRGYAHRSVDVAFSPDGRRLATAGGDEGFGKGGGVKVWDAGSGLEVLTLGGSETMSCLAFSRDGHRLAAASVTGPTFNFLAFPAGEVTIWDATPSGP